MISNIPEERNWMQLSCGKFGVAEIHQVVKQKITKYPFSVPNSTLAVIPQAKVAERKRRKPAVVVVTSVKTSASWPQKTNGVLGNPGEGRNNNVVNALLSLHKFIVHLYFG